MKKHLIRILLLIPFIWNCNSTSNLKKEYMKVNPQFAQYVEGYTSGMIAKTDKICIKLNQFVDSVPNNVFSFSPAIDGYTSVDKDRKTIVFSPLKKLKQNKVYTAKVNLKAFFKGINAKLETFKFQFQTKEQQLSASSIALIPYANNNTQWSSLHYKMFSADALSNTDLNQLVAAKQGNNTLKCRWIKNTDNSLTFVLDSVQRMLTKSKVSIEINGDKIEANDIKYTYQVPTIDEFEVTNIVSIPNTSNSMVDVYFSDPLQQEDLKSLFSINENKATIFSTEVSNNKVRLILSNTVGENAMLTINGNILNYKGKPLGTNVTKEINIGIVNPKIEFIGNGNIIPNSNKILLPFACQGLKGVHVKIYKVFENNMLQFFQSNDLKGSYRLREVATPAYEKDLIIQAQNGLKLNDRNVFSLDLSKYIAPEQGAMYRVELSMRPYLSNAACLNTVALNTNVNQVGEGGDWEEDSDFVEYDEYGDNYDSYFYPDNFNWNDQNNPCTESYYTGDKSITKNIIASNLGIIAKMGNSHNLHIAVTNLLNTNPISDVKINVYDFQKQIIATLNTNSDGFAEIPLTKKPFMLIANNGKEKGYLKLNYGDALNISDFDVDGEITKDGIKGTAYGERDVWRPGDDIYLTCVLQNNRFKIPEDYPVKMEFYSPQNQLFDQVINSENQNGFYSFKLRTPADGETGKWSVVFTAGKYTFTKTVSVETIKPNKLKINFAVNPILKSDGSNASLNVNWLHGGVAANLKTSILASLKSTKTEFAGFNNYVFDNPNATELEQEFGLYEGSLNATGQAIVPIKLNLNTKPAGKVKVGLFTKVFEQGGEFSTRYDVVDYSPYSSYVGIKPTYKNASLDLLETGITHAIIIANVKETGEIKQNGKVKATLYRLKNRYWYHSSNNETDFMSTSYSTKIKTEDINMPRGKGSFALRVEEEQWGQYYLHVEDLESGHSAGKVLWVDWPNWSTRGNTGNDATTLNFKTVKETYKVGEMVEIMVNSSQNSRALLSIENGSDVILKKWVKTEAGQTKLSFEATSSMCPNVYANISIVQAHSQTQNDMPMRIFGICPVKIENPKSHLQPIIQAPAKIEPEQNYAVKVSEKNGSEMTYTLAIVDEGLLDITNFKTPNLWDIFNAKEGLGVRSWDMYSDVLGAYKGQIASVFAIGGGGDKLAQLDKNNINRFKPVVTFLGPFTIKGETKNHQLTMSNYIGSARVMVIAGNSQNQFGSTFANIKVSKPLMVATTLPRVVSPNETVMVPITLFNEPQIKQSSLQVKINTLGVIENANQTISLSSAGETIAYVPLKIGNNIGKLVFTVEAKSGQYKANETIELEVRMPNPSITKSFFSVLANGEENTFSYQPFGIPETQKVVLEVSSLPSINLESRLNYLITYPYGCVEQTTSSVFPQLYLTNFMELSETKKAEIEKNVKEGIERLKQFQQTSGGFSYWPEAGNADEWGSVYATHFLLEAKNLGYNVSSESIDLALSFLNNKVNNWTSSLSEISYYENNQTQAYRLYVLALGNKANISAMNRLKESKNLNQQDAWRLAAAYAIINKPVVSSGLLNKVTNNTPNYDATFGSAERDLAIKLETHVMLNQQNVAFNLVNKLAQVLNTDKWLNTQSTAYCLIAIGKYIGKTKPSGLDLEITENGKPTIKLKNKTTFFKQVSLGLTSNAVKIKNNSKSKLFVQIINAGVPADSIISPTQSNLNLQVDYLDLNNLLINKNALQSGTDFKAKITITNPGLLGNYTNLALNHMVPSGWEIINKRVFSTFNTSEGSIPTYQNIKDDRIYTFFDLAAGQSKTFVVLLHAAYKGNYVLPAIRCSAMYENEINANTESGKASVN